MVDDTPPPAILLQWSNDDQVWLATALALGSRVTNVTTSDGPTPSAALDALLEKAFCLGAEFRPSQARIEHGGTDV